MTREKVKVLYIAAMGRSGSTILGNVLGEAPGIFSAGEVHNLWRRGLGMGHVCGCGHPVPNCTLWSAVVGDAYRAGGRSVDLADVMAWKSGSVRRRHLIRLLSARRLEDLGRDANLYGSALSALYRSLAHRTGAGLIVDSSKWPSAAALLRLLPDIDAHVVHLIRDPRGVAYSRSVQKQNGSRAMRVASPGSIARAWSIRNLMIEAVRRRYPGDRFLRVRYEDFAADPQGVSKEILRMAQAHDAKVPIDEAGSIRLHRNHNVAGNPGRFEVGPIIVRPDERWKTQMTERAAGVSTAFSLPLLHRYGYPVRPSLNRTRRDEARLAPRL